MYFSIIKATYEKLTTNIKLNGEKHFLWDQEQGKDDHTNNFHTIILEVLGRAVRQEKTIKGVHIGKE